MKTKVCTQCHIEKQLDEFPKCSKRSDGRYSWCKTCTNARRRAYKDEHPDRVKVSKSKYYHEHKQEVSEKIKVLDQARKQRDPETFKSQANERARRYYATHASECRKRSNAYRSNHPDRVYAQIVARRANQKKSREHFTPVQFAQLCAKHNNLCLCCGASGPLTADHVVPLSSGGSDGIENIQPLCIECNTRKGKKSTDYRP